MRTRRDRESATFEYDKSWLVHPERFSLEPALKPGPGPFHTPSDQPLFGAIGDSAPDRWGRTLMRRAERRRADREGVTPRTLGEIDYLSMVDDEARLGALRFAGSERGPFLAEAGLSRIPPLVELPRLLSAADHAASDTDTEEDLRLLLAPGSSLGGARPKASVRDRDGHLAIAKFPSRNDEFNTVMWEALALTLAAKAGIPVSAWRVETVADRPVLLLRRFDREHAARLPFLSAMSMLGAKDNQDHSYLEFVDILRQHGAAPKEDMHAARSVPACAGPNRWRRPSSNSDNLVGELVMNQSRPVTAASHINHPNSPVPWKRSRGFAPHANPRGAGQTRQRPLRASFAAPARTPPRQS
jgi:serine/threonine-protein kinase HipA